MKIHYWILSCALIFSACIGDDIIFDMVDPEIRITNPVDTIEVNTTYQFEYLYLNNVGNQEDVDVTWSSSDPAILEIDDSGLASALQAGAVDVSVSYEIDSAIVQDVLSTYVGTQTTTNPTERTGTIRTTSSYVLEGTFNITENGSGGILIDIADDYRASSALPGLYLYLTNNPNTINSALEVGEVNVFSGAHSYDIPDVGLNEYGYLLYFCKPFNVKVGDGQIN